MRTSEYKSNIKSSLTINYLLIWIHLKTLNNNPFHKRKKTNDWTKNSKINKNSKQDKQAEGLVRILKEGTLSVVVARSIFLIQHFIPI